MSRLMYEVSSASMSLAASRLIRSQVALGDPAVSRDGALVAYTRRTVERNAYRTRLWLVATAGGRPRALTRGAVDDSAPAFAADGAHVLFLRERQVHRVAISGGEPERLTSLPHGVDAFALSPDGRRLLLTGSTPEARFAVGPLVEGQDPRARVLRRVDWRLDGSGILDRHAHLWVAPARAGARARRIVAGDRSVAGATWSPDGRRVAYVTDPDPDGDLLGRTRIFTIDAAGSEGRSRSRHSRAPAARRHGRRTGATSPSAGSTRRASRGARPSRYGSCRRAAAQPAISLPEGTCIRGRATAPT